MTHEELRDLINAETTLQSYPDPAWDYYILWHEMRKVTHNLRTLMNFIGDQENATEQANDTICEKLTDLIDQLTGVRDRM